jgi:hypothetical protein
MGALGASWKTSVIGFVAGILTYFVQLGPHLPNTGAEWGSAGLAAAIFAFGAVTKDANVSNAPAPVSAQPVSVVNEAKPNPAG